MNNEFKSLVRELTAIWGPTGREHAAARRIAEIAKPYVDEISTDALGNLICVKKGTSGKRVMLSAHMDQIGLIVLDIDEKGFLRFAPVGGIDRQITPCREVVFENGTRGVTYFEDKKLTPADAKLSDMFIDIGCTNREEAEAHVSVGDVCTYAPHFVDMGGRIACGALDDRICCAIILKALEDMHTEHDVYAVFTAQEEVGLRGAMAAAYSVDPDFAINLDVTASADTPECERMPMAMGRGPAIKFQDRSMVATKPVIDKVREVAKKHGITVQNEILLYGGTDAGAIQPSRGGKNACCISIATRYIHSPVELADVGDCEKAIELIRHLAAECID